MRLALDGHLKLSVNFVNNTYAIRGRLVSFEDDDDFSSLLNDMPDEKKDKFIKGMKKYSIFGDRIPRLDDKVSCIDGVWDLSMAGNERLDIEHEYQMLTDGPEVTLQGLDGAFVEREDGQVCQLQTDYDDNEYQIGSSAQLKKIKEHIANNKIQGGKAKELLDQHKKEREEYLRHRNKNKHSDNYFPAGGLPGDSVLVVRTKALMDLHDQVLRKESNKEKVLDARSERTYLNIIGALLEVVTGTFKNETFSSETQLRDFIAEKFDDLRGVAPRTLADKFALAKKAVNGDLD